jgi:hypothetical protein
MKNIEFYAEKLKERIRDAGHALNLCDLVCEIEELVQCCDNTECAECQCGIIDKLMAERVDENVE